MPHMILQRSAPVTASGYVLVEAKNSAMYAGATSQIVTLATTPVTGDLVVVASGSASSPRLTISTVASTGATWARAVVTAVNSVFVAEIWYSTNVTTNSVQVTYPGAAYGSFTLYHFSGNLVSSPLDVTSSAFSTTTTPAPGSITPTAGSEVVIAVLSTNQTITASPTGYSNRAIVNDTVGGVFTQTGFVIQSAAAATNPTWALAVGGEWKAAIAAFKHV